MVGFFDRQPGKRWPRSQKFRLSARGADAEARYRQMIVEARSVSGRPSFDAARAAWAATVATIKPEDGLYLGELRNGPRSIEEVAQALESCGSTRTEVKAGIDRLAEAGMIEPVAAPVAVR